jgi:DegV family protein with EDD domain
MRIHYLNGNRLFLAVLAGGEAVIRDRAYLDRINVFPVPDADTGTNLASTMKAIAEGAEAHGSIWMTLRSIASAALSGAQGNSGIIFAQFIHGFSQEVGKESRLTTASFAESARRAVQHAYRAILHPVEGTMITVIRDWAEAAYQKRNQTGDFTELLGESLKAARHSLRETTKKLSVLARAGVVDAGAKGFVDFLEGIHHFIKKGRLDRPAARPEGPLNELPLKAPAVDKPPHRRYCAEALLSGTSLDVDRIRTAVERYGLSAVVAGSEEKVRLHVHTDDPAGLFFDLKDWGAATWIKVDDIKKQYEAAHARKSNIAIVTDSSCDLPPPVLDERQIHVIPFSLSFGERKFLDKITIVPKKFYELLRVSRTRPKTSQPPLGSIASLLTFLAGHYQSLVVLTISDKLTGLYGACRKIAGEMPGVKISVLDSRTLSAALGLLVARASEMALAGSSHEAIVKAAESWISKTETLVDVATIKYLVRGGRLSPAKGIIARLLNVRPIITLDENGQSAVCGKSFRRSANMSKILGRIREAAASRRIWGYAVVHALNPDRAALYGRKLTGILGKPPAYTMDVAPVIGVHSGIGAVAVALLFE